MTSAKVLVVLGTRPEAIKLAPVILALRQHGFVVRVCSTGQHRDILQQVFDVFSLSPDHDLSVMQAGQTLSQTAARILGSLQSVLQQEEPDLVLVQGDTTTTLMGAMAAFYAGIPSGHVEAGLRTGDLGQPFPEEMHRVLASRLATLHFAATTQAAAALRNEAITEGVWVTGNTGIDALLSVARRLQSGELRSRLRLPLDPARRLIVVTTHRRESFGPGLERTCAALARLAGRPNVQIVLPVHPNPNVRPVVERLLGGLSNILLVEPVDYVEFIDLMSRSYFLLTDSGGIQEEAPSLGKPVLVLRDKTERPEALAAGTARLVGTDVERIVAEATLLLEDNEEYNRRAGVKNPFGDGQASQRIAEAIRQWITVSNRAGN